MLLAATNSINSFLQLCTVLFIFVLVLAITWIATKWIANVQNGRVGGANIEVVETYRLTTNKYIQVVRVGKQYMALAICKDTVTFLAEIAEENIQLSDKSVEGTTDFKEFLKKAIKMDKNRKNEE
ncbi:MAG: flagellar biosynthetic protein FliO [Lachnospiraceae bacterium]|nr:flagellar biosynthetic protein FliO [Lachnospiraceae bacterium]